MYFRLSSTVINIRIADNSKKINEIHYHIDEIKFSSVLFPSRNYATFFSEKQFTSKYIVNPFTLDVHPIRVYPILYYILCYVINY